MCGIFGITNAADAAVLAAIAAHALQHRGQEGAGIAVTDCVHMRAHRAVGLQVTRLPTKRSSHH